MGFFEKLGEIERSALSELDSKLALCAYLTMRPFQCEMKNNRWCQKNWIYDFSDYSQAFIPTLEKMYSERNPAEKREGVQDTIRCFLYEFEDLLTGIDKSLLTVENGYEYKELKLSYPIIVYCVAINNLFNHFTNIKRSYREKNMAEENESEDDKDSKKKKVAKVIKRREICQITRKEAGIRTERAESIRQKKHEFSGTISNMRRLFNEENGTKIRDKDFRAIIPLDFALQMLENHHYVRGYAESAQIGMFLREILEIGFENDQPLDKLLRLFMVNQINRILIRTGAMNALCSDVFFDVRSQNNLLQWYYNSLHPSDSENYLWEMHNCLKWILEDLKEIKEQKERGDVPYQSDLYNLFENGPAEEKPSFCSCYKELETILSELELEQRDVDDLMEFYLNQQKMEKVSHWENLSEEYYYYLERILHGKEEPRKIVDFDTEIISKVLRAIRCEKISDSVDVALWSLFGKNRKKGSTKGGKNTI